MFDFVSLLYNNNNAITIVLTFPLPLHVCLFRYFIDYEQWFAASRPYTREVTHFANEPYLVVDLSNACLPPYDERCAPLTATLWFNACMPPYDEVYAGRTPLTATPCFNACLPPYDEVYAGRTPLTATQ